jgi:hypothetical protein
LPLPEEHQALAARCLAAAGVQARVLLAAVAVPCVVGVLRPVVLLPLTLCAQVPPAQVEALLLHELAHLRRRDWLGTALATTVETVLFFHPGAWWLARRLRIEREPAADARAVACGADRRALAAALLALAEAALPRPALAATGGDLTDRVRRLVDAPVRRQVRGRLLALLLAPLAVAVALSACGTARTAPGLVERVPGSLEWPPLPPVDRARVIATLGQQVETQVRLLDVAPAALASLGIASGQAGALTGDQVQRLMAMAQDDEQAAVRVLHRPTLTTYPHQRAYADCALSSSYIADFTLRPDHQGADPVLASVRTGFSVGVTAAPDGAAIRIEQCDIAMVRIADIERWEGIADTMPSPQPLPVQVPVLAFHAASLRAVRLDAQSAGWLVPFAAWIERGHTRVRLPRTRLIGHDVFQDQRTPKPLADDRVLVALVTAQVAGELLTERISTAGADPALLQKPVDVPAQTTFRAVLAAGQAQAGLIAIAGDAAATTAELDAPLLLTPGARPLIDVLREALAQTLFVADFQPQGLRVIPLMGFDFPMPQLGWQDAADVSGTPPRQ